MAVTTSRTCHAVGMVGFATSWIIGLGAVTSAVHATPDGDNSSVQEQIVQAQHDVEVVTEQYNDAKIKLAELNEAQQAAEIVAAQASASLADAKDEVAGIGVSLHKGPSLVGAATIMTAGTPQEVIDKLNTLAQISDHYGDTVAVLVDSRTKATVAADAAEKAAAQAARTEQELAAKKSQIEAKLPDLEAQLAALTEGELQAVLAQAGGHATAREVATQSPPQVGAGGSATAQGAVDAALTRLGMPYEWAAAGPNSFDCSGLTMWAYAQVGVSLPHSSTAQASSGTTVPISAVVPGDILWMPGHVGMYIGNGQVVHAPTTGDVVKVVSVSSMSWQKAVRIA